jgi:UDP-2,4-diacetamido-2,4,6-trideoxy-beta-L-altropyranose hydrolase
MRCLALAQAWRESRGEVEFLMTTPSPAIVARLRREGMSVSTLSAQRGGIDDARQTDEYARSSGSRWIVIDGYQFAPTYHRALKGAGYFVLHIDDGMHPGRYFADIVVDQNICAIESTYAEREPYTRLLLGTRYAMLRREFTSTPRPVRDFPVVARKILVTLGGADSENATSNVLRSLERVDIDGAEAVVVAGSSNPNIGLLERELAGLKFNARLQANVNDMQPLMRWADVAISAAGSTCWELCYMGLPSILLVLADNQERIAAELSGRGIAASMRRFGACAVNEVATELAALMRNAERRARFGQAGQQLVDGRGAYRVVSSLGEAP